MPHLSDGLYIFIVFTTHSCIMVVFCPLHVDVRRHLFRLTPEHLALGGCLAAGIFVVFYAFEGCIVISLTLYVEGMSVNNISFAVPSSQLPRTASD
mmetsp:Transcript_10318/g.15787  ORF Transcript_10318/g.15787 Transcript_10318/m.15787 type:complete len:96 (-) Transcript_10318:4897-5184(-)